MAAAGRGKLVCARFEKPERPEERDDAKDLNAADLNVADATGRLGGSGRRAAGLWANVQTVLTARNSMPHRHLL